MTSQAHGGGKPRHYNQAVHCSSASVGDVAEGFELLFEVLGEVLGL